jgi:hypothetical protein
VLRPVKCPGATQSVHPVTNRGLCQVCNRPFKLCKDGTVHGHLNMKSLCPGSRLVPKVENSPMYRTRWLSFRGWLAIQIKRKGERLSWWVNP